MAHSWSSASAGSSSRPICESSYSTRSGGPGITRAVDDPASLELLHPLGQEPVGELRDGLRDLGEAQRAIHQDPHDRAGPAASDQLYRFVVVGTTPRPVFTAATSRLLAGAHLNCEAYAA